MKNKKISNHEICNITSPLNNIKIKFSVARKKNTPTVQKINFKSKFEKKIYIKRFLFRA